MARPSHRIRNLQAFLDEGGVQGGSTSPLALTLALFVGAPLGLILVTNLEEGGTFLWIVAALLMTVIALVTGLQVAHGRRQPDRQPWNMETLTALNELSSFHRDGSLEERLDPTVGDELERCAAAHKEIALILQRPEWEKAEGHRLSAKTSVLSAVDALMGDALLIATGGVRARGMRRDAFAKRMQNPDVHGPMMKSLVRVRGGLESLRSELGNHPIASPDSMTDLRTALDKLTEIRQAEEELHQSL